METDEKTQYLFIKELYKQEVHHEKTKRMKNYNRMGKVLTNNEKLYNL